MNVIKSILRVIGGVIGSIYIPIKLKRVKYKDKMIVAMPNGIGEMVSVGTYLPEYEKRISKKIMLLVPENRISVVQFINYNHYAIVPMNKVSRFCIHSMLYTKFGKEMNKLYSGFFLYPMKAPKDTIHEKKFIWNLKDKMGVTDFNSPEKPIYKVELSEKERKIGRKINSSTIFLNPYARTIKQIDFDFWERLAAKLKIKGYEVITILGSGEQEAVSGTIGILCGLSDAVAMLQKSGGLIGVRSGFMDLIAGLDIPIVCVYPKDCELMDFFGLSNLEYDNKVIEIEVRDENAVTEVADRFSEMIK